MKTKKLISTFSILFALLFMISCDNGFEETNTNPNDPSSVPSNLLLGGILRATSNRIQNTSLVGESNLCWMQQLSKPQYNNGDLYDPRTGGIQSLWDVLYSSAIADAQKMYALAVEEGNAKNQAIALVLQAFSFQILTDAFGDVPFTEAALGDSGNFTPAYDSSETVYNGILALLDQAIPLFDKSGDIDASQDLLYGGDASKWKKFAASLKFRAIMRISDAPNFTVGNQLQNLVNSGNLFTSNAEEAKLLYLSAPPNANPYYSIVQSGRGKEWSMGENLVKMMDGTIFGVFDNRLTIYAKKTSDNTYRGLPAGLSSNPGNDFTDPISEIGDYFLKAEGYGYFMTYSQLSFLMAEAAEKNYISGSAATYFKNGIQASFNSVGASLGNYPTTYSGGEAGLKQIAEQEYIALFLQGYEAWAEWRRKKIPALTPAPAGVINQIPSRYSYPQDEQADNVENYKNAVSSQGSDVLTTPIWWMK